VVKAMRAESLKRILIVAGVCVIASALLACVVFPEPEEEGDSLVIGSLILDFPEGLYKAIPQKIDMNVRVSFRNVTRNETFHVYTKRGYFYFPTNGTDEFILESFRILKTQVEDTVHTFYDQHVDLKILNFPNTVIYLGHVNATYSAPRLTRERGASSGFRYYRYGVSVTVEWDQDLLQRYMERRQPDSPWLNLGIIEYGMNSQAQWQQQALMERRSHPNFLLRM
jgi:hypothetical protein